MLWELALARFWEEDFENQVLGNKSWNQDRDLGVGNQAIGVSGQGHLSLTCVSCLHLNSNFSDSIEFDKIPQLLRLDSKH